jgi:isoquinoline 1-oxidoreductase beta subunit
MEAQVEGGILWGLSALRTEVGFRDGAVEQGGFEDFPLVRMGSDPAIEVVPVESDLPPLGLGEQPVPPAIPAVLNAACDATGARLRTLPLRQPDPRLAAGAPARGEP